MKKVLVLVAAIPFVVQILIVFCPQFKLFRILQSFDFGMREACVKIVQKVKAF